MLSVLINTHMLMAAQRSRRRDGSSSRRPRACTPPTGRRRPERHRAEGRRRLSGDARGRLRLGEAVQRADVPRTSARISASRRASPGTTTSTAPTARATVAGRRRRRPSAARSIEAKLIGSTRDRDLGRRRADAELHVRRRLRRRHADASPTSDVDRADEHRQLRAGHDQPTGRRSSRTSPTSSSSADYDARCAAGRSRPKQRQHPDPGPARVGALDHASSGNGAHVRVDLRPDGRPETARRWQVGFPLSSNRCARAGAGAFAWLKTNQMEAGSL